MSCLYYCLLGFALSSRKMETHQVCRSYVIGGWLALFCFYLIFLVMFMRTTASSSSSRPVSYFVMSIKCDLACCCYWSWCCCCAGDDWIAVVNDAFVLNCYSWKGSCQFWVLFHYIALVVVVLWLVVVVVDVLGVVVVEKASIWCCCCCWFCCCNVQLHLQELCWDEMFTNGVVVEKDWSR